MSQCFSPIKFQITDGFGHMFKRTKTPEGTVEATHTSISCVAIIYNEYIKCTLFFG